MLSHTRQVNTNDYYRKVDIVSETVLGRPPIDPQDRKTYQVTVPLEEKYREVVRAAVINTGAGSVANYGRSLVLKDLQERGLINGQHQPIPQEENA
jgi:hypothetical protein